MSVLLIALTISDQVLLTYVSAFYKALNTTMSCSHHLICLLLRELRGVCCTSHLRTNVYPLCPSADLGCFADGRHITLIYVYQPFSPGQHQTSYSRSYNDTLSQRRIDLENRQKVCYILHFLLSCCRKSTDSPCSPRSALRTNLKSYHFYYTTMIASGTKQHSLHIAPVRGRSCGPSAY